MTLAMSLISYHYWMDEVQDLVFHVLRCKKNEPEMCGERSIFGVTLALESCMMCDVLSCREGLFCARLDHQEVLLCQSTCPHKKLFHSPLAPNLC